jgi:cell division septum initiation protein DivIVA
VGQHIGQGIRSTVTNVARLGVVAGGALAVNIKAGIDSLAELQRVELLTTTALKSTGSAAAGSAADIRKRALALEDMTTVDDKAIQNAENLLLTFRQIGKDAFDPTLKAAIDMNAALGGDENSLQSVLIQVGKAVNDPIKGLTSLRRVGVSFSADQEKRIKKLIDENRLYDAQRLILQELSKEFSGAGKAFGTGPAADMRRFGDAVEDTQQALATGFLPLMQKISKQVQTALGDPKVQANIRNFGRGLADSVQQVIDIGSRLPWGAIGTSAKLLGEGAKGLLDAFTHFPPWVQTAVLTGWGLNKLTGGALGNLFADGIKLAFPKIDIFSRGAPGNPMFVTVTNPGLGGPGGVTGGGGGFGKALGVAIGAVAVAEISKEIGRSAFFDPTVKPAVTFEQSQFLRLLDAGDPAAQMRGLQAIQHGIDKMNEFGLAGQFLFGDQIDELKRQGVLLSQAIEANKQTAEAAQGSRKTEEGILNEAKASRLAAAHQSAAQLASLHGLEAKLIHDPNFKPHVDSVAQFIRLLRRTSEFGARGVGTDIEQGRKTGRDPVGDAFVALISRLKPPLLKANVVQGEISRHIKALEQVQGRLLRDGNIAAARHAQRNIDKLSRLIGEVDKTIPHFRRLEEKAERQRQEAQATKLATERGLAQANRQLGIVANKNFSPSFNASIYTTVNANLSTYSAVQTINRVDTIQYNGKQVPLNM